jgi:signal transduction histidine kinase
MVTSYSYGVADGMLSRECNGAAPAGWKSRDGRMWFGTIKGAVAIDPRTVRASRPPKVSIEQVAIDRRIIEVGQPVRVQPGEDNVEIKYTGLSWNRPAHIQFRVQLAGLDGDWVEMGTRRSSYYSHVPPGRYMFRVIADNGDGVWNSEGASVGVSFLPPFYSTWWFRALVTLSLAGLAWLAWQRRVSQWKRAQAAQQAFSRQLIASHENERKRIAAELHDSLGQRLIIVKNLALLLLQTRTGASGLNGTQREQVEEISAEVSGAVREVKEISYNLRPYRLDRLGLTAALRAMIETALASSLTTFCAEIDNIDGVFPKQAEINFYRIVQECVNNILKHSQAAQASVRIRRTKERLTLTVRDDGRGFAEDSAQAGSLEGFGLTGISERAQLLGGRAAIHSAPGQGTTVTIEINSEGLNHER